MKEHNHTTDLNTRRGTPAQYAAYMRKNPVYWKDLHMRLAEPSDGCAALWAAVVRQAILSAGLIVPTDEAKTLKKQIAILSDRKAFPVFSKAHSLRLQRFKNNLARINAIAGEKESAISFIEGDLFALVCQECDIDPAPARKAIKARIERRERTERRRIAASGG